MDADGSTILTAERGVDQSATFARQRMALLRDLVRRHAASPSWSEVCEQSSAAIEANPCGISFALIYILDPLRARLSLIASTGVAVELFDVPRTMPFDGNASWSTGEVLRRGEPREITNLDAVFAAASAAFARPPKSAVMLPIAAVQGEAAGVMIVGLEAPPPIDTVTRDFLGLLVAQVAAGIAHSMLAHNRSTFQTLALTAPAAVFMKDIKGRYAFANSLACEMLGHTNVLGRTDAELLAASTAARLGEQDRMVIESNGSFEREERIGSRHFLLIKFPWPNPDGGVAGLYGVAIDISERKRMEETLRNSERQYRAIGESIDYGVWVCDAEGRNVYTSDSFLKLTGLTQKECSDLGWGSVLHPDDLDATIEAWRACVSSGGLWDREHRIKGLDGEYHHVLARGVPVRDQSGNTVSWAGINLDISHIKEAEEKLREADRRKDEFLSLLAHELRNPLAPIRNSLHVMRLRGFDDEVLRHAHDVISRQVSSLVRMVDDLLDVGRITHGKLALQMERVELSRTIEDAIETSRPYIDEMRHQLTVELPPQSVTLNADPMRVTQVIANLLSNSAKYTPAGGQIKLSATVALDGVEIAVADNGVGIAPEQQHSVFEMFSQLHGRGLGSASGLGIGLALVRDLVEMHGGTVSAASGGVGKGSTFTVWLPSVPAAKSGVEQEGGVAVELGTDPSWRVLVVDDNIDAAESMGALLTLLGHDSAIAHDGHQAVELASSFEPDLVLMDIGMPGMDGLQATAQIRALPLARQPTVVAVTGWNQEAARAESRNAGIDRHVVKPIDIDGLRKILRALRPVAVSRAAAERR